MSDPLFFEKHEFASGLELYRQHRDLPWFACRLIIDGGHMRDPLGKEGTAHLLEHHLYSGTEGLPTDESFDRDQWCREREIIIDSGCTSMFDSTYGGATFNWNAETLLRYLADFAFRPVLGDDFLEKEREIVRLERIDRKSEKSLRVERAFNATFYGSHRRATATGLPEDDVLDGLTLGDLRAFHRRCYGASNAKLLIVGGLCIEPLLGCIEDWFRRSPDDGFERIRRPYREDFSLRKPAFGEFLRDDGKPPRSVKIDMCWQTPNEDFFAARLAKPLLRKLVNRRLREEARLAYGVVTGMDYHSDTTVFSLEAEVKPDAVEEARRIIVGCLDEDAEQRRLVEQMKRTAAFEMQMADISARHALQSAENDLDSCGRVFSLEDDLEGYRRLDGDRIRAFIRDQLSPAKCYTRLFYD